MIRYFIVLTIIFSGCTLPTSSKKSEDIFDKLIKVHNANDINKLIEVFGQPKKILSEENSDLLEYQYPKFSTSVDKNTKKIVGTSMPFWKEFDAYAFLKKRFSDYKWVERPVSSKNIDVVEDRYKVKIPELGIIFEYDNQDPLRRPMWIFFK